jgi:hypothetical protein
MRRLADAHSEGSASNTLRSRRFQAFSDLVERVRREGEVVRILDIGGTNAFWEQRGWAERDDVEVVIANLEAEEQLHAHIVPVAADATDMRQYDAGSFDIVFSNSVIEHLRTRANQEAMASEVRRIASVYWVQTPNFWFPIEPHFLTPAWHWLPVSVRVALIRRRRFGWRGPCPDRHEAEEIVREIRLLRRRELEKMFPDATLVREKIGPLVKSFVAVRS